ncbi:protein Lilipod isoform X2 [Drosophila persimilis]|uniref:Protein Lilipod isoform X2 n=1 Tax=Drosophila pseudoobscura pseudoobscura TaxID=46245 RepID=A0A6I8WDT5_DROPS|nr:protein Lilipod isoform X2 [Drosophila persimilis]XP_033241596.1 protein Lilipod isoform X2 [Drosophila pseudoobscura]
MDEEEEEVTDLKLQLFHNTVREHIIFLLLIILLYFSSYVVVSRFRRRDRDDLYSNDEDEVLVYRISFWLCTFTLAVAEGAAMLLPVSIASNEVLLLYPNSYYVKWLNSSLIQGLWNHVFLFSNLSLFIFLPFVYLFTESTGFVGHKKGILPRVYETFTVFMLMAVIVLVLTAVLSAVFGIEKLQFFWFLNLGSVHLPFLYSCVSFLGVMLMLICTPCGFVRLFGVVNQVLVRPMLRRDVNEEFDAFFMEEASVKRKLAHIELYNVSIADATNGHHRNGRSRGYLHPSLLQQSLEHLYQRKPTGFNASEQQLNERLRELDCERKELDKQRKSSTFQRSFVYPLAMLLLLFCTGMTILLVVQNTLELLIGIKALPLSTRQFTLGISSLSKLGPFGAGLEVCLIFYLGATSVVGFYSMPFMRTVRPKRHQTSLPQLMLNCGFMLVLSSALPLLSRIIGITNFDLLGDFGAIEWLGNFQIVLLYNLVFGTTTALCLANKFSATVRRELRARLTSFFLLA